MISWNYIARAIDYYQLSGFNYIEVPWIVSGDAIYSTIPKDRSPIPTNNEFLVGSAEQSFVQLMIDQKIEPGKYVAASPCFRDDSEDKLHKKYFFKVELIYLDNKQLSYNDLYNLIKVAYKYYESIVLNKNKLNIVKTNIGFDIEYNNIEIGSYGIRDYNGWYWVYGTGFAEPRYSIVCGL
jgi:seryl-tRNA synthetase